MCRRWHGGRPWWNMFPAPPSKRASSAAQLHDIGDLVLFQNWRDDYLAIDLGDRLVDERRRFGATHGDLGGYQCALWDLPGDVIRALANGHEPSTIGTTDVTPTTVAHAARALVDAGLDPSAAEFDVDHLEAVGATSHVEDWAFAAQEA